MERMREAVLSKTQMGIYVECMNRPESTLYNLPFLGKLGENIRIEKLKGAIEAAIKAHPCLETYIYVGEDGKVMQKVKEDISGVQVIELSDEAFEHRKAELVRPFKLLADCLYRQEIYVTPSGNYWFQDIHHIIFDGTSHGIFAKDIKSAYEGETLKTEEYDACDVARDEESLYGSDVYNRAKEFYKNLLDGQDGDCLPVRDVWEDTPKQGWLSHEFTVDPVALKKLRKEISVSTTAYFTSVMGFLIAKYNYAENSVISTIYNGRNTKEKQNVVSMLVKTLPFATNISGDCKVKDYLKISNDNLIKSREHDIYSFGEMAAEFGVSSDINFAYQGRILDYQLMADSDIVVERIYDEKHIENTALLFEISDLGEGRYEIHAGYRADMFSYDLVMNMARAYGKVAQEFLVKENIDDVEIADETVFAQIDTFNQTECEFNKEKTVVDLFREQAKLHPDNIALVYLEKKYTYKELDEITDILAKNLRKYGIGKETVAGVLIPRCEYMVICALGILKAGGAYLPLDSTYPQERLNLMMQDSGAKVLITTEVLKSVISEEFTGKRIMTGEILAMEDNGEALPSPEKHDLFIMLYTSGSTGLPKGVMLEHGNIAAFCNWAKKYYSIDESTRSAAYASFGFDANMFDTYPVLTNGGCLYIIDESIRLNLIELQKYYNENEITHSLITTQVGRQFALMDGTESLKHLTVGGEKLVPLDPPSYNMYNAYGPTECTVLVSVAKVDRKYKDIPIGPAVDNTKLYVVDKNGKLLPPGAAGELWIAGYQVGRAYLNRPEQTALAFTENPFCKETGYERVYHTGDIVRYMNDGAVQFIGRRDGQVKIRGFRIELTEVEEVIRRFPGIKEATVAAFDEVSGGKFIAAYIVADEEISIDALNAFIMDEKPPYMVPAVIMQIDKIPMTQNQKVNKRALPKPEKKAEELVKPETQIQKRIFECIEDAIGHENFGITTDIYYAGLTSISSIRLNMLLSKEFDIVIKTSDLKNNSTILQLEQFVLGSKKAKEYAVQDVYPMTASQSGVFIDCTANMGTTVYNMPFLMEISKEVDVYRLKEAVELTADAHPYLKMQIFMDEDGNVCQRRNDSLPVEVKIIDDMDPKMLVRPFGLFNEPLYRFEIYRTVEVNYLFMDVHHIIADGTSMGILIEDINRAYAGEELETETYSSYEAALDYEELLHSDTYKKAEEFYQKEFGGCGGNTAFYPDKNEKTPKAGYLGTTDENITPEMVKEVCEKYGITENVFFTGVFGAVLAKYHFKEESVFTTIYHGRNDSRLANTVGMLVKTFPVRARLTENGKDYFTKIRDQLMNAMDYDCYPFAEVSRKYDIKPDTLFIYQGDNFEFDSVGGKEAKIIPLSIDMAKEPISFQVSIENGRFVYRVDYRSDMFEDETIRYMLDNFAIMADGFVNEKSFGQIQLMFEEEKEMVEDPVYTGKTFVDLFADAVEKYGDRPAVRDLNGTITYAELDRMSDYVAQILTEKGFGPESTAGILSGRTKEFVIAYVGIMKAGGAYVPLDPEYPQERLEYMLEDSGAKNLLAVKEYEHLVKFYDGNILWMDDVVEESKGFTLTAELAHAKPDNLAYMIYTSGSTGRPKGVMIEHRNLVNLIQHEVYFHKPVPGDIYAEFASFCFDASVHDLFVPLTVGSLLYIFPENIRKDAVQVAEAIRKEKITLSTFPTQMGELLAEILVDDCDLRILTLGGEKFKRYYNRSYIMVNGYGPTENTVSSTEFVVDKDYKNIPIGKSQVNVRSYIVDENLKRVPVGASGELCHAGRQVARGYHDLPKKTAAVFVENPFMTCKDDARMYRTGDMVRMKGDGNIEYIGRIDSQVKISGYRVELSEIEGAVLAYPEIREAAVTVIEKSGNKYIVAYYTGAKPDTEEWKEFLKPLLPNYMIPSFYVALDKMPITPGGKIDKRSLPEPEISVERIGYEPPVNSIQAELCGMFEKALGIEKVGIDDNFFELGGTSLTASKVAVMCLTKQIAIVYADVFKYPTVRQLAALLNQDSVEETEEKDEFSDYNYEKINYVLAPNRTKNADIVQGEDIGDILLTGATGFLGIHVLKAFLEQYEGTAYCLVRKGAYPTPEKRLMHMLMYYFETPFEELFGERIICIDGDITDANKVTGLSKYPFKTLINCAACVKHFSSDDTLERINVTGVKNLIELCAAANRRLIQISTISCAGEGVGDNPGMNRELHENELYFGQRITNEYIRTKFLAERYVLESIYDGLDAKVIRVGNLMSRDSDGEFQINFITNGFLRSVRGYAAVGAFPMSGMSASAEFSPIDSTAAAILTLSGTDKRFTVYHASNNHGIFMSDLIYAMRKLGFEIKIVGDEEFGKLLNEYADTHESTDAVSGLIAYTSREKEPVYAIGYNNRYTTEVLYRMGYKWPITDDRYLENAIEKLDLLGFFDDEQM